MNKTKQNHQKKTKKSLQKQLAVLFFVGKVQEFVFRNVFIANRLTASVKKNSRNRIFSAFEISPS